MFEDIRDPQARVRAVSAYGSQVSTDLSIPAKRYFRSGKEMLRMANVYCDEKNFEAAFILYTKYITLFVEQLPKHPDYKNVPPALLKESNQKLKDVFPIAEIVKKKLKTRYTEQEIARRELEKKEAAALAKRQEEERIREEKRKLEEEQKRKEAEERANDMRLVYGEDKIKEQEEQFRLLREQQEKERQKKLEQEKRAAMTTPQNEAIQPSAPSFGGNAAAANLTAEELAALAISQQMPSVPPPSYGDVAAKSEPVLPSVPSRDLKPSASTPAVDRSTKPDHFMSTGDTTSNRFNLKNVWVPAELMVKFLNLAQANTNQGIETGGFLFGKFAQGQFRITHLILPDQMGKPDSFTDLSDEDELFNIQDQYDVTQLGWIHTHPTQTAFLSSVDQHVQASFQRMLPESIAIVCSPKFNETGLFYLTPDYGLDYVVNCTGTGFHPHPSSPTIFETCSHAQIDNSGKITVVDLRKNKR